MYINILSMDDTFIYFSFTLTHIHTLLSLMFNHFKLICC